MAFGGETGNLARLPEALRTHIRSGIAIASIAQCVEELVYNSIDAHASCIGVRVDLTQCKVQVFDNGHGISKNELQKVGSRYFTSKCHTLKDLEICHLNYHGYRGEALASLRYLSGIIQIISRTQSDTKTWSAMFARGIRRPVEVYFHNRPTQGTTITAINIMHNLPVRQKMVNPTLETEDIRLNMCAIALAHPQVAFTLHNESNGQKLVQTKKTEKVAHVFAMLFGEEWKSDEKFADVDAKRQPCAKIKSDLKLTGIIGKEAASSNDKQFLYVNKRLVRSSKLNKVVKSAFKGSLIVTSSSARNRVENSSIPKPNFGPESPRSKAVDKSTPVFCLSLQVAPNLFDLTFHPRKTTIEFDHWDLISEFVESAVHDVLKRNRLFPPSAYAGQENQLPTYDFHDITGIVPINYTMVEEDEEQEMKEGEHSGDVKTATAIPPLSKLSNLDALNIYGSRQSVPVTKKMKKNDASHSNQNSSNRSNENRTSKTPLSRNYTLNERGIFKKLTPITSMKLSDPRSEKLSIAALRRRYGLSSNEKPETFRTTIVTRASTHPDLKKGEAESNPTKRSLLNYEIAPKDGLGKGIPRHGYSQTITAFFSDEVVDDNERLEEKEEAVIKHAVSTSSSPTAVSQSNVCSLQEGEEVACQILRQIYQTESGLFSQKGDVAKPPSRHHTTGLDSSVAYDLFSGSNHQESGFYSNEETSSYHFESPANYNQLIQEVACKNQLIRQEQGFSNHLVCQQTGPIPKSTRTHSTSSDPRSIGSSKHSKHSGLYYSGRTTIQRQTELEETGLQESACNWRNPNKFRSIDRNPESSQENQNFQNQFRFNHFNPIYQSQSIYNQVDPIYDYQSNQGNPKSRHNPKTSRCHNQSTPNYGQIATHDQSPFNFGNPVDQDQSIHGNPAMTSSPYPEDLKRNPEECNQVTSKAQVSIWLDQHVKAVQQEDLSRTVTQDNSLPRNQFRNNVDQHFSNCCAATRLSFQSPDRQDRLQKHDNPRSSTPIPMDQQDNPIQTSTDLANPTRLSTSIDKNPGQNSTNRWSSYLQQSQEDGMKYQSPSSMKPVVRSYPQLETGQSVPDKQYLHSEHQNHKFPSLSYGSRQRSQDGPRFQDHIKQQDRLILDPPKPYAANHVVISNVENTCQEEQLSEMNTPPSFNFHNHVPLTTDQESGIFNSLNKPEKIFQESATKNSCFLNCPQSDFKPCTLKSIKIDGNLQDCSNLATSQAKSPYFKILSKTVQAKDKNEIKKCSSNSPYFKIPNSRDKFNSSEQCLDKGNNQNSPKGSFHSHREKKPQDESHLNSKPLTTDFDPSQLERRSQSIMRDVTLIETSPPYQMTNTLTSTPIISTANRNGFVADFNLMDESLVILPQSNSGENEAGLPDGWSKRTNTHGKTFWVHLQSGNCKEINNDVIVDDLSKCKEESTTTMINEMSKQLGEKKQLARKTVLWPLPPGKSPFLSRQKMMGSKNCSNEKNCSTENLVEIVDSEVELLQVKWSGGSKKMVICEEKSANAIVSSWQNPVFKYQSDPCHNVQKNSKFVPKDCYKFDKGLFRNLRVLGQVDRKFIAGILVGKHNDDLLLLFDQHAVHERIRLENLIEKNYPSQKAVLSIQLDDSFSIEFPPEIVRILTQYSDKIGTFGLQIAINSNRIEVTGVPQCFSERHLSEKKSRRPSTLRNLVENLIQEFVSVMVKTRGGFGLLPKTIGNILNSQACRGAIKFGNDLTHEDCLVLLNQLESCQAPFQCAHGRPSLAPIINLQKLSENMISIPPSGKLNFVRLKKMAQNLGK